MKKIFVKDLIGNSTFDFGSVSVTEKDIIDFAEFFDPLDFHTNKDVAEKSIFKGLITSGPHIFNIFYKTKWIPLFGDSVLAGLEINSWKFLKPTYANMKVFCKVCITGIKNVKENNNVAIKWHFDFTNKNGESLQMLDMLILHDAKK